MNANHPKPSPASRWLALRAVVPTAFLLAFFYFCGLVFYQESLSAWGFDPSLFPISTQEIYVEAYVCLVELATMLMDSIAHALGWLLLLVLILAVIDLIPWRKGWHAFIETSAGRAVEDLIWPARGRGLGTIAARLLLGALFALCAALIGVLAVNVVLSHAADRSVRRAWDRRAFENWPTIRWLEDDNTLASGYLKTCSTQWCAVLQADRARVIAVGQVRAIDKVAPVSSASSRQQK